LSKHAHRYNGRFLDAINTGIGRIMLNLSFTSKGLMYTKPTQTLQNQAEHVSLVV